MSQSKNRSVLGLSMAGTWQLFSLKLSVGLLLLATALRAAADCTPPASNLIGWWPGDGNAGNVFGTNNGTLQGGANAGNVGFVGNAFSFDGTNGYVQIADSPLFHPTNLTIEAWVRFNGLDSAGSGPAAGIQYIVFKQNSRSGGFEGFVLNKTRTGSGDIFQFLVTSSAGISAAAQSTTLISTGAWYHVAGVRGSNFIQIYVNGVMQHQVAVGFAQDYGNLPLYFGTTGQGFWDRKLKGNLDEVALYNRALGSNEIAAVYAAGAAGKCKAPLITVPPQSATVSLSDSTNFTVSATGFGSLYYQWRFNGNPIPGATDATLTLTNIQGSAAGNYSVAVSNSLGVAISADAALVVKVLPDLLWNVDFGSGTTTAKAGLAAVGHTSLDYWNFYDDAGGGRTNGGLRLLKTARTNDSPVGISVPLAPGDWGLSTPDPMYAGYIYGGGASVVTITNLPAGTYSFYYYTPDGGARLITGGTNYGNKSASDINAPLWREGQQYVVFREVPIAGPTQAVAMVSLGGTAGFATLSGIQIAGAVAPRIWMQPTNMTVVSPGSFTVAMTGEGVPTPYYQWYRDNIPISNSVRVLNANSNLLTLSGALPTDSGNYYVVLTNLYGAVTSQVAAVNVGAVPNITLQPVSQAKAPGETVLFFTIVSGTAPLTFEWRLNGVTITNDARHSGATTSNLTIINLSSADSGNYQLTVRNAFGTNSSSLAALLVLPPPVISTQPQSQTASLSNDVAFSCIATGGPPIALQWYFNGAPLSGGGRIGGTTTNRLTISNVQTNDAGVYWLVASNAIAAVTSSVVTLTVVSPACAPPPNGLIGWWDASDHSFDIVGLNHGSPTGGVSYVAGKVGKAFSFDGVNDRISTASAKYIQITNSYTMEFWVWPKAARALTGENTSGTPGTANQRYAIFPENTLTYIAGAGVSVGTNGIGVFEHSGFYLPALLEYNAPVTGWTHVAVVYVNRQPRLYVNGQLVRVGLTSTFISCPSGQLGELGIGYGYYSGLLDEVSIYDRPLSGAEVQAIYDASFQGKCMPPLAVAFQPQVRTNYEGESASFSGVAVGLQPISYWWLRNGVPLTDDGRILGATSNVLAISSLMLTDSGNYQLVASNQWGTATGGVATLTVLPRVCVPPPSGLVGWWTAEGQANDLVGTNHGIMINGAAFAAGKVGACFSFDGVDDRIWTEHGTYRYITNTYSMEFWVWPTAGRNPTSESSNGTAGTSGQRYAIFPDYTLTSLVGAGVSVGTNGVSVFEHGGLYLPSLLVYNAPINGWTHIVVVYQNRRPSLYVNGVLVRTGLTSSRDSFPSAQLGETGHGYGYFKGLLDEVSIYDHALTAPEVKALYDSDFQGKCSPPPSVALAAGNRTNYVGQSVSFDAIVNGSLPYSLQWYFNGVPLTDGGGRLGTSTSRLTLTNLDSGAAGNYWLVLSNALTVTTSSVANLSVLSPACASALPGLVGWWPGDGHGYDYSGTNHGNLLGGVAFTAGKVGAAFQFDGVDDRVATTVRYPDIIDTYTMEFWAWPTAGRASTYEGDAGVLGLANQRYAIFPDLSLPASVGAGVSVGTNGISVFEHGAGYLAPLLVYDAPILGWTHVAVVYENRKPKLYVNGVWVHTGLTSLQASSPSAQFGEGGFGYGYYSGLLDEVSIYNRALTASEVQSLHNASFLGRCPQPARLAPLPALSWVIAGSNIVLNAVSISTPATGWQWYFNDLPLTNDARTTGATAPSLIITNSQLSDTGNYFVVATNPGGAFTSSVANVQIGLPPAVVQSLTNLYALTGGVAQITATVTGTEPMTYQWFQAATPLVDDARHFGAGTTNLVITNLLTSDTGNYILRATNFFGSTTTTVATLTVSTPPAITIQPVGASVPLGLAITLSVTAVGTAPLQYQWMQDGVPVPSPGGRLLSLSNLTAANFGNYQVVVTNFGGSVTSAVAQLTAGNVAVWGMHSQVSSVPLWPGPGLSNVVAVSAGSGYSLALRDNGTVYGWGSSAALGIPPGLSGVVAIAAGTSHALALRSNGMVVTWGGNITTTNVPASLSNVVAITAGSSHSAALRSDGSVAAWGLNSSGQTNVTPGLVNVTDIDAGGTYTVAIRAGGKLAAWGGLGDLKTAPPLPEGNNFVDVSAGAIHTMAVNDQGTVFAWGGFRAGDPSTNIPAGVNGIVAVEAAGTLDQTTGVSIVLRSNGTVFAWGATLNGTLTNVPAALSNVVAISGGVSHGLALINDGRPLIVRQPVGGSFYTGRELRLGAKAIGQAALEFQWFKNDALLPGATNESLVLPAAEIADGGDYYLVASNALGVAQSVTVPVTVLPRQPMLMVQPATNTIGYYGSPASVAASAVGSGPMQYSWLKDGDFLPEHTNDLQFDRTLPAHGGSYRLVASNLYGSVTSAVAQITFRRAAYWGTTFASTNLSLDLSNLVAVAAGSTHVLTLRADGTVAAAASVSSSATNVPPGLNNAVAIAAGNNFSLALRGDGNVMAWGLGTSGQTNVPPGVSNIMAIAAGESHVLALRSNGTVVAWGLNTSGQTTVPSTLSNVVAISAGRRHSLALKNDGSIMGWGFSGSPPPITNAVAIAAGYDQSVVLLADGTLRAWLSGGGATGLPAGLSNIVAIGSGGSPASFVHSVAVRNDGTFFAWGSAYQGQSFIPAGVTSGQTVAPGGTSMFVVLNDRVPVVTAQSSSRRVAPGTNVTLAALSVGRPTLSYQWTFAGDIIPGATNPTLTLSNVNRAVSGDYLAHVSNSLGATDSRIIHLDVGGVLQLLAPAVGPDGTITFGVGDNAGSLLGAGDLSAIGVQASSNLVDWETLTNALIFTNGAVQLQDVSQTNYPIRFYRLLEQ